MSDLPARVATALVLGVCIIGGMFYSWWTLGFVLLIIGFFSSYEYIRLAAFGAEISHPNRLAIVGSCCAIVPLLIFLIQSAIAPSIDLAPGLIITLISITMLLAYHLIKNETGDWRSYQATAMALVYIGLPMLLMQWIAQYNGTYEWLKPMTLLILIWCNDVMAYFTGRLLGKRLLYPIISPKKTLEGFIGGLIMTVTGGLILSIFIHHLTPVQWVIYGFIVSVVSTIGDLFESMIKRRYGVKDSGQSLPGHGGFLDRFDAFIFVIPIASLFLYLCWK